MVPGCIPIGQHGQLQLQLCQFKQSDEHDGSPLCFCAFCVYEWRIPSAAIWSSEEFHQSSGRAQNPRASDVLRALLPRKPIYQSRAPLHDGSLPSSDSVGAPAIIETSEKGFRFSVSLLLRNTSEALERLRHDCVLRGQAKMVRSHASIPHRYSTTRFNSRQASRTARFNSS